MLNREELAWAAGFVDGEGYTGFHVNQKSRPSDQRQYGAVSLTVAQCNKEPLERLQKALGMGKIWGPYAKKKKNHRPSYTFSITGFERTQAAIAMLWSWLGPVKREQAKQALQSYKDFANRPKLRLGPKPKTPTCHPDRKHSAHGLCESCYHSLWYQRKKNGK